MALLSVSPWAVFVFIYVQPSSRWAALVIGNRPEMLCIVTQRLRFCASMSINHPVTRRLLFMLLSVYPSFLTAKPSVFFTPPIYPLVSICFHLQCRLNCIGFIPLPLFFFFVLLENLKCFLLLCYFSLFCSPSSFKLVVESERRFRVGRLGWKEEKNRQREMACVPDDAYRLFGNHYSKEDPMSPWWCQLVHSRATRSSPPFAALLRDTSRSLRPGSNAPWWSLCH